ncbi:hypothetical protein TNCV_1099171 [Trichonephila clavipes]|nr:hypothetical protein TNCV_1099171 [Trichonephila clavipes]
MKIGMPVCHDACPDHQTTSTVVVLFDNVRKPILTNGFSPDENTSRVAVLTESQLITEENYSPYLPLSKAATRRLLATDIVILNHSQVTRTTPELAPPLLTSTPYQGEEVSASTDSRLTTRWVFRGTGLELTLATSPLL